MNKITVDLSKKLGQIKPMHCVNNGPACNSRVPKDSSNFYLYKELGIPYEEVTKSGGDSLINVERIK